MLRITPVGMTMGAIVMSGADLCPQFVISSAVEKSGPRAVSITQVITEVAPVGMARNL